MAERRPPEEDRLGTYRAKRDFAQTPEPSGARAAAGEGAPRFVVQKHHARRLHYDFRLEADGVLVSWAVPKGPSLDPHDKRLAVHVEDHPLDYRSFEGVIPSAQYGAGTVIVWDEGTYRNLTTKRGKPVPIAEAVAAGHLSVWLEGAKLRGGWALTRTGAQGDREAWILVKRSDERAAPGTDITAEAPNSARSGRSLDEVGADATAERWTRERATWAPPMLATPVRPEAHLRVAQAGEWRYEPKLDGVRCLAVRNGADVELWSRNHLSMNARFPAVVAALGRLPADNFTLDGEMVAYDGARTSFARLQGPGTDRQPVFRAFDLLHLLGQDTTELGLAERISLLHQLLGEGSAEVAAMDEVTGDPAAAFARACQQGWEGLVAKRAGSTYQGGRSDDWRKLKCTAGQELVIGGWTDPSGSRLGFGALLVGYYDDDGALRYAGKVGTGFDQATLRVLGEELRARGRDDSPFVDAVAAKGTHWVAPELVAAVAFREWTADGRLRQPSFQGLRTDKDPRSVRRETPREEG